MAVYKSLASSSLSPYMKEVSINLNYTRFSDGRRRENECLYINPSLFPRIVQVKSTAIKCNLQDNQTIVRRSANYQSSIWKHEFIQSLPSEFMEETYARRLNKLKIVVSDIMSQRTKDPLKKLELIDILQRLGISYHFESEIKNILENRYNSNSHIVNDSMKNNLYATALEFRLFRQHEFKISQDVFNGFMDEMRNFNVDLNEDAKGMLALYEASFLLREGENVLEEAKCFTTNYLEKYIINKDEKEVEIIKHALELPLHWRMKRLEARWFIDIYEREKNMNPIILEMAKLDFNMVQFIHQQELKYTSSWWISTGLGENMKFARDRLVENFLWTVGVGFEPEFGYFRRMATKINVLITTIDDVYDVYGTLDELQLFTNAVERWDVAAIDQLPDYLKTCFFTLHNSINEMAFEALRDKGVNVIQYLKKLWVDLCKSYLVEAKWYHSGYKPTLEEYLDNGRISIGAPVALCHIYVLVTSPIIKDDMESLNQFVDIIRCVATISRLLNDLGTSPDELKRGDVLKSTQYYMNETGVSESSAREYIRHLIYESWKKLNKVEAKNSVFSKVFIELCKNGPRITHCMYQYGDGHGTVHKETKDRVMSLFLEPIPIS